MKTYFQLSSHCNYEEQNAMSAVHHAASRLPSNYYRTFILKWQRLQLQARSPCGTNEILCIESGAINKLALSLLDSSNFLPQGDVCLAQGTDESTFLEISGTACKNERFCYQYLFQGRLRNSVSLPRKAYRARFILPDQQIPTSP